MAFRVAFPGAGLPPSHCEARRCPASRPCTACAQSQGLTRTPPWNQQAPQNIHLRRTAVLRKHPVPLLTHTCTQHGKLFTIASYAKGVSVSNTIWFLMSWHQGLKLVSPPHHTAAVTATLLYALSQGLQWPVGDPGLTRGSLFLSMFRQHSCP